jgi:hypothetical protein
MSERMLSHRAEQIHFDRSRRRIPVYQLRRLRDCSRCIQSSLRRAPLEPAMPTVTGPAAVLIIMGHCLTTFVARRS